jgi:drug/metabolite transporter (DMT)-like permease
MSNNKLAIFLIITSVFFGTVMLSFLKIAQEDVNVYVAGFFRFFLGLVIILPYIIKNKDTVLKTTHLKQHFLRAILGLPAMLLYFSALVLLPIEKLTAISFVVPLIVTILAVFFLGEKIYIYRTLASNTWFQWNVGNYSTWFCRYIYWSLYGFIFCITLVN